MASSREPLILVWPALDRLPRCTATLERFTPRREYGEDEALRFRIDL